MRAVNVELIRHTALPRDPIRRLAVAIARAVPGDALALTFRIEGELAHLCLPEVTVPRRADALWQQSCFEAFLRPAGGYAYFEFNFSPTGAWAAYRFGGRRLGRELPELTAPKMEVRRGPDWLAMDIRLALDELPELALAASISVGLAAVVEDEHGDLSYWALAHGAARPDFHDPATFTLRVPA